MKYFKEILAVLVIIAFLFVYLFIPNTITISENAIATQTGTGVVRSFMQIQYWDRWMPKKAIEGHSFIWEDGKLTINASFIASVKASFEKEGFDAPVTFSAIDAGKDSTFIRYEAVIDNRHLSPITRINNYLESRKLKTQLDKILKAASSYYSTSKGVYGFDIKITRVKDSTLITTQKNFTDSPSLKQIYSLVDLLDKHILANKGIKHGDPMVNITRLGDKTVYAQVAYPLASDIPGSNDIIIKKMRLGNIIEVKVTGNQRKVDKAFLEAENFMQDKQKTSPAMSFIMYNTNRLAQPDANKWISTIYYPIY
jgi:hypothetical protein